MLLAELDTTVRGRAATLLAESRGVGRLAGLRQRAARFLRGPCAALVTVISANAGHAAPVTQGLRATSVDPVVLMRGKDIVTCGFIAQFADGNVRANVTLSLQKYKKAREGTRVGLAADWRDAGGVRHDIRRMLFKTDDTEDVSVDLAPGEAQGFVERAGLKGAMLFRNAMLAGATVDLKDQQGETVRLTIPGPVPNSVRAAYLNCAGDMFKPTGARKR